MAVLNDPHSNSRSVAELALGEIIMLLRRTFTASTELHRGTWNKTASGCHEVRGLVLGIVGYGRIGSQLSDLAEAVGMRVIFSDVTDVLARGNAKRGTFEDILQQADIELACRWQASQSQPVRRERIPADETGRLFPQPEPGDLWWITKRSGATWRAGGSPERRSTCSRTNQKAVGPFASPLQNLANVILTPHIGGSTEEAQQNIGQFVRAPGRVSADRQHDAERKPPALPARTFSAVAPAPAYSSECSGNVVRGE